MPKATKRKPARRAPVRDEERQRLDYARDLRRSVARERRIRQLTRELELLEQRARQALTDFAHRVLLREGFQVVPLDQAADAGAGEKL